MTLHEESSLKMKILISIEYMCLRIIDLPIPTYDRCRLDPVVVEPTIVSLILKA